MGVTYETTEKKFVFDFEHEKLRTLVWPSEGHILKALFGKSHYLLVNEKAAAVLAAFSNVSLI